MKDNYSLKMSMYLFNILNPSKDNDYINSILKYQGSK